MTYIICVVTLNHCENGFKPQGQPQASPAYHKSNTSVITSFDELNRYIMLF